MAAKKPVFLLSLGCAKNTVDSERLMRQAEQNGLRFVETAEEASIILVNTCGFIADAKAESIEAILAAAEKRKNGEIEALYAMGCLSALYAEELRAELPEIDRFFGASDIEAIIEQLGGTLERTSLHERSLLTPPHYAWLKIAEGCSHTCSFCAIPKMRGRYKSETVETVLREARALRKKNVKELDIIAQDISAYGYDLYGASKLGELLLRLSDLGFHWIRLLYAHPLDFPLDVIDIMRERENICNYLDMPIQHIDNGVLASMRRGLDEQSTIRLLATIREKNPDIRLRTTLIVGYPGETERAFEKLLRFVDAFRFDRLGCFAYSHEEHTAAYATLADTLPEAEKQERVEAIMAAQERIAAEKNRAFEGKTIEVLIDETDGSTAYGRTEYDAPEVDNDCIVQAQGIALSPGDFCTARIEKSTAYELHGVAAEPPRSPGNDAGGCPGVVRGW